MPECKWVLVFNHNHCQTCGFVSAVQHLLHQDLAWLQGPLHPSTSKPQIKHCYGTQKSTGLVLVLYTQAGMNYCPQAPMKWPVNKLKDKEMPWILKGKFNQCKTSIWSVHMSTRSAQKGHHKGFLHTLFRHPWIVLWIPSTLKGVNSVDYCWHE